MARITRGDRMKRFADNYKSITLATNLLEDEANKFGLNFDRSLVSRACSTGALHFISSAEETEVTSDNIYKAAKEAGGIAVDGINSRGGE